ncbi:MAG: hypothetical protein KC503_16855 [Myxococcales bacterium]|nr:hypothetical protein [Myxococcales bacterium]
MKRKATGFAPQRSVLAARQRHQMLTARRRSRTRLLLALAACLPLGGCALFGASSLWWVLAVLLASSVAVASGGRTPAARRAAPTPASSAHKATPPPAPSFAKCSGWVHKSCYNNKIVGSCCPKNAKCNYRYSPYTDCGQGTCVSGQRDQAKCPHRKKGPKTKKACDAKRGLWRQTCQSHRLGMECLPGMPTNFNGKVSDIYPAARFVRCAAAPDPACVLGSNKAKCKTLKKGKKR